MSTTGNSVRDIIDQAIAVSEKILTRGNAHFRLHSGPSREILSIYQKKRSGEEFIVTYKDCQKVLSSVEKTQDEFKKKVIGSYISHINTTRIGLYELGLLKDFFQLKKCSIGVKLICLERPNEKNREKAWRTMCNAHPYLIPMHKNHLEKAASEIAESEIGQAFALIEKALMDPNESSAYSANQDQFLMGQGESSLQTIVTKAPILYLMLCLQSMRRPASDARVNFELCGKILTAILADQLTTKESPTMDERLLAFFTPKNNYPTNLLLNEEYRYDRLFYMPPESGRINRSMTTKIFVEMLSATLFKLWEDQVTKAIEVRNTLAMADEEISTLLIKKNNIMTYGSSKINICTQEMLRFIQKHFGLALSFKWIDAQGKTHDEFDQKNAKSKDMVALQWMDHPLMIHRMNQVDHGLVARVKPDAGDPRVWWIFAGCSRAGSVAARKLIFEPQWCDIFWKTYESKGRPESFAVAYSVDYDNKQVPSECPAPPHFLDFRILD